MDLATQLRPTVRVKLNELAKTGSHGAELCVEACVSTGVKAQDEVIVTTADLTNIRSQKYGNTPFT